MAIPAELYELSSRDPDGSIWTGARREIITGKEGSTGLVPYQLTAEQSGALIVNNSLTGSLYRLPTPVPGMWFEFVTLLACTSNEYKVITKAIVTEFILGAVTATHATVGSSGTAYPAVTGDSFVSHNQNGTTTGGVPGDQLILTAISTTRWVASGWSVQSGSTGDPWSTS
jgi:hypothetical protein